MLQNFKSAFGSIQIFRGYRVADFFSSILRLAIFGKIINYSEKSSGKNIRDVVSRYFAAGGSPAESYKRRARR